MITSLKPNQVFVFGSNLAGRHGKGAALWAKRFGAKNGQGLGRCKQTYAIPTKDRNIQTLPLRQIHGFVAEFIRHAIESENDEFLVTEIGCGLAGYSPRDIAPMFDECPRNVVLPESFIRILSK